MPIIISVMITGYKLYVGDGVSSADMAKLPDWRREKAARYKLPQDRQNCAAAYLLLERAFAEHGLRLCEYPWRFGAYGKPFTDAPLSFNISHCGDMVVCAISGFEIGVDVQKIEPIDMDMARYALNDKELALLRRASDKEYAFCKIWTAKEVAAKYMGIGMDAPKLVKAPKGCNVEWTELPGCLIAVCSKTHTYI